MEVVEPGKGAVLQNRFSHYVYKMEAIKLPSGLGVPQNMEAAGFSKTLSSIYQTFPPTIDAK